MSTDLPTARRLIAAAIGYTQERRGITAVPATSLVDSVADWQVGREEAFSDVEAYLRGVAELLAADSGPVPCHYCNMLVAPDTVGGGVHATHPAISNPWDCLANPNGHLIAKS